MPVEYDVDPETGLVRVEAVGVVSPFEYLDIWELLMDDPRVSPAPRLVAGFEELVELATPGDVRNVAAGTKRVDDFVRGGRLAIVANSDAIFGFGRMFEALVSEKGLEVRVFRADGPATAWALDGD